MQKEGGDGENRKKEEKKNKAMGKHSLSYSSGHRRRPFAVPRQSRLVFPDPAQTRRQHEARAKKFLRFVGPILTNSHVSVPSSSPVGSADARKRRRRSMEANHRKARSLIHRLASSPARSATTAEAIAEIRFLSKCDPEIRVPLADFGAVPLLASALLDHDSSATETLENASAALLNLSISAREAVMSSRGILDALTAALRLPYPPAGQNAAATLYSLLSVDEYRPIIGSKRPLISALLDLFRRPTGAPTRSIKDALKAIFLLALYPLNRATLVELGAVPPLFALVVKDGRRGVMEDATAVISQVAGCYESVDAFRRVAGVAILVELVDSATGASQRTRENAAAALLNLVMSGGDKAVDDVMEVDGAEAVVRELAEGLGGDVSSRGKSKADSLLRVLERVRGGHLVHG